MLLFPLLLTLHIAAGAVCLLTGAMAAFSRKRRGLHTAVGEIYHGAFIVIFLTSVTMAVWHWAQSAYLLYIGTFSYGLALFGYAAKKRRWSNWLGKHIGGMLGSYIAIITAVLVVNGHLMPLVRDVPTLWIWLLPTIIGTPLIFLVGRRYRRGGARARRTP